MFYFHIIIMISLDKVLIGQISIIKNIEEENIKYKKRLLDMGLTKGTKVIVKRKNFNNNLTTIFLRDYNLTLNLNEISKIKVEIIN